MRIIQITAKKLMSLIFLLVGGLLIAMWLNDSFYMKVDNYLATANVSITQFGIIVGSIMAIMGLLGLFPTKKRKRRNAITFPGTQGQITIELAPVEATLNRVVSKMPEVKKISVAVTPSEDNRRAQVDAEVWMYKGAETAGAREISNRIENHLKDTAVNILGVDDVTTVNLRVRGIIVDQSKAKPKPAPEPQPEPKAEPKAVVEERPVASQPFVAAPVDVEEERTATPAWRHETSEPEQEVREEPQTSFSELNELPPLSRPEDEEESQVDEIEHKLRLGAGNDFADEDENKKERE